MNDGDMFIKTDSGTEEVRSRSRKLAPRLRTMLIMVDGTVSYRQLQKAATALAAPADFLQTLLDLGLVAPRDRGVPLAQPQGVDVEVSAPAPVLSDPERFRAAQKFMNDSAVDTLGLRAFFFTLKLEKSFTCDDLRALLPDFSKALTKGGGPEMARVLEARVREILG
jgi:hypothetical protein